MLNGISSTLEKLSQVVCHQPQAAEVALLAKQPNLMLNQGSDMNQG